jgi:hypothetical protein
VSLRTQLAAARLQADIAQAQLEIADDTRMTYALRRVVPVKEAARAANSGGRPMSERLEEEPLANAERLERVRRVIGRLRGLYPFEFKDGVAAGLGNELTGSREPGDYP